MLPKEFVRAYVVSKGFNSNNNNNKKMRSQNEGTQVI